MTDRIILSQTNTELAAANVWYENKTELTEPGLNMMVEERERLAERISNSGENIQQTNKRRKKLSSRLVEKRGDE